MTNTTKPQSAIQVAFVATCNTDGSFGLGAAERDKSGYWPMPGYGTFATYEAASARARELNAKLGIELETAAEIVCSSMRGK